VKKAGAWNEEIQSSQEYDLIFRLLKSNAKLHYSDSVGAIVRERESGQISTSNPIPRWTNYLNLRKQILNHLLEKEGSYFEKEKSFFYQAYFDVLHIVFPYIPNEAKAEFNRVIKGRFTPQPSPASGALFVRLVRLFGFEGAQRIKKLLGK